MTAGIEVRVEHVSKSFGGVHAVRDVTARFPPGMVTGLIGPNGAGKTCLLDLVSGISRVDQGHIAIGDTEVTRRGARKRHLLGMARVFQGVRAFGSSTIDENLRLASKSAADTAGGIKAAYSMLERVVGPEGARGREHTAALPYATQKALPLAMAIAAGPRVLLLDEPTVGFTSDMYQLIAAEIRKIAAAGVCVVLVEHNLDVMRDLADRVLFMAEGSILREGSFDELASDRILRDRYFGA